MANSRRRQKRCRYCKELFSPDPRIGSRQYACSKKSCQRNRNQIKEANRLKRHPDYFKGQYPQKKAWWESHPDYLKGYRKQHPEYVARDNEKRKIRHQRSKKRRADIHTAISTQPAVMNELKDSLFSSPSADIHTELMGQLVIISLFSYHYLFRVCADIHTEIDSPPPPPYRRAHDHQTSTYS